MDTVPMGLTTFEAQASEVFAPLRMIAGGDATYRAAFDAAYLRDVVTTRITGDPIVVRREQALIGSSDPELFKVAWHRQGRAGVQQDGRQCRLGAGQMVVYDTTRPYELYFWEPYEIVVVGIPRERFGPKAGLISRRVARPIEAGLGLRNLIAEFCQGLSDSSNTGAGPVVQEYLGEALLSLIMSAFVDAEPAGGQLESTLLERVQAYCLANLHDPDLSMRTLASAHCISVRYLQKLAQDQGISLAAWIRRQRLQRIRRDLSDPALAHRTPAALAARWGVLDGDHLGRALKAEFGMTITQIRRNTGSV